MSGRSVLAVAPGKLVIAGEYAVLEPGCGAVVTAVERTVTVRAVEDGAARIRTDGGALGIAWREAGGRVALAGESARLRFVASALEAALCSLRMDGLCLPPFSLEIKSDLADGAGRKLGMGSSAAVSVAVVAAVHALADTDPARRDLFRLAALAHFAAQGNGSGADVAASVHGGWLRYDAAGLRWAQSLVAGGEQIERVTRLRWPGPDPLSMEPPSGIELGVAWTGAAFSTADALNSADRYRAACPDGYADFLRRSRAGVSELVDAFRRRDAAHTISVLRGARRTLVEFGRTSGIDVEPPLLKRLADGAEAVGGAGKPSGAGGGDCAIALVPSSPRVRDALFEQWRALGATPLDLLGGAKGVTVSEVG